MAPCVRVCESESERDRERERASLMVGLKWKVSIRGIGEYGWSSICNIILLSKIRLYHSRHKHAFTQCVASRNPLSVCHSLVIFFWHVFIINSLTKYLSVNYWKLVLWDVIWVCLLVDVRREEVYFRTPAAKLQLRIYAAQLHDKLFWTERPVQWHHSWLWFQNLSSVSHSYKLTHGFTSWQPSIGPRGDHY